MNKQKLIFASFILTCLQVFAQDNGAMNTSLDRKKTVVDLRNRWAVANYELKDKAQIQAFEQLIADADHATSSQSEQAGIWIWSGIIKSTFAGVRGGPGALKYAKAAKIDLDRAISIDPNALQGSAYTSLGTLYYHVPSSPIGFGDDEKAEEFFKKALAVNPNGIDSNYFYGQYLLGKKQYRRAEQYLLKAQQVTPRPQRPLADKGRQVDIAVLLAEVSKK